MRSHQSDFRTDQVAGPAAAVTRKPVLRSSAIFPVIHSKRKSTKILFLGYWLLKRKIFEVAVLSTLRDASGITISREHTIISNAKAYSIKLSDLLPHDSASDFEGSLEVEVFSTRDLVFPYPAFVLTYFNRNFSSVVHTVGRIYNDIEDLHINEEYRVGESGFDIYGRDGLSPFVAFTNGPMQQDDPSVDYEVVDREAKATAGRFELAPLRPYETRYLRLKDHIDLTHLLGDAPGMIRFGHNFKGFFPRFLAGNIDERGDAISITHSFYDSSTITDASAYWRRKDPRFIDALTAIPLYLTGGYYTRLAVYPIYSPSDFSLRFRFYDSEGTLLYETNELDVRSAEVGCRQIDFASLLADANVAIDDAKTAQMIAMWEDETRIPTRFKFGLNVGHRDSTSAPTNVCCSPRIIDENALLKPGAFRWAPMVNVGSSEVVLTNAAALHQYDRSANLTLRFYREHDDDVIERKASIPANGSLAIRLSDDQELSGFFGHESGWVAAQADNPFVEGYYFDFCDGGVVAADHVF